MGAPVADRAASDEGIWSWNVHKIWRMSRGGEQRRKWQPRRLTGEDSSFNEHGFTLEGRRGNQSDRASSFVDVPHWLPCHSALESCSTDVSKAESEGICKTIIRTDTANGPLVSNSAYTP